MKTKMQIGLEITNCKLVIMTLCTIKDLLKVMPAISQKTPVKKTSGLVDIGLIDDKRKLSNAGKALLRISTENNFSSDNQFQIAKDSFIYLKQLLKTYYEIEGQTVRPFMVLLRLLSTFDYLTLDEYTYLLPLCIGAKETTEIVGGIANLRSNRTSIDDIIINRLMNMPNYIVALEYLLENDVTEDLVCEIGLNRKKPSI